MYATLHLQQTIICSFFKMLECVSYNYGQNCAFDCGHCKDGRSCAAENGVCKDGCDYGWIGDLCVTGDLQRLI